jgi:hypothetical protein
MIHLNSMFSPENNVAPPSHNTKDALRGFHEVLSDAVSSKPEKLGIHPKDGNISIARAGAATPPEAPTNTALPETSSSTSGAPDDGYNPFLQAAYSNPFQSAPTASTSQSTANPNSSPSDAQQAFDDAYWAAQPAPVQALRTMQDPEQRTGLATQLANEGYTIDVPIMVWGWDPSITMAMRQADGYTWVPSALQNPVADAPGLPSMGTVSAYNPNNPPAGSIAV